MKFLLPDYRQHLLRLGSSKFSCVVYLGGPEFVQICKEHDKKNLHPRRFQISKLQLSRVHTSLYSSLIDPEQEFLLWSVERCL